MPPNKKVLILCQRKAGPFYAGRESTKNIEEEVAPKINDLVHFLLGPETTIEYLSSLTGEHAKGNVDIKGELSLTSSTNLILNHGEVEEEISVKEFINRNRGTYALIILNTCPFMFMDFTIIDDLLAPTGLIVFSAYPRAIPSTFKVTKTEPLFQLDEELMERLPESIIFVQIYKKIARKKKTSSPKSKKSSGKIKSSDKTLDKKSSARKSGGRRTKKIKNMRRKKKRY
jgi:hypothetical protein